MHFLHRKVQNSVDLLSGIYYECAGNGAGVRNPTIEEMKEYLSGNFVQMYRDIWDSFGQVREIYGGEKAE